MPLHNADIATAFDEIADLLDVEGADLTSLPGIVEDLAGKIREMVDSGHWLVDRLHGELPPAITELLHIPGLGPKRVHALWHDLAVQTLEQVALATRDGRIRAALRRMRNRGGRRVPVKWKEGELVGILAVDDVLEAVADELREMVWAIGSEHVREEQARG